MNESRDVRDPLDAVRRRLAMEFGDEFDSGQLASMVASAATQFTDASITAFVPMLVEKSVRQHIRDRETNKARR